MITPTVKETSICIINCPDISTFININGMSLIQSFSEILHRKIYVGNVFSLHAKIILSKINALLKNAMIDPIKIDHKN